MKTLILVLLVLVTPVLSIQAQNRTVRENTYALIGPVHTVRQETANIVEKDGRYVEEPRVLSMTITFNGYGGRTDVSFYDAKGSLRRRIEGRYDGRRELAYLNYDGAGKMWLRIEHLYNDKGQHTGSASYGGDGALIQQTITTRNDQGQPIEFLEHDANGNVLSSSKSTYGPTGELKTVERVSYTPDGMLRGRELVDMPTKRTESVTYNADGSIAGKSVRVDREISEYDVDGNLKKTTQVTSVGRLPEVSTHNADGTTRKETPKVDELDARGNWIKMTTYVTDARGTRPVKVTYRTITYFVAL